MEKVINLEFNSSGVLINHDEGEIRQGDKGVVINAIFDGKNNANYIARFNLTRSDGTQSVNNIMSADATNPRKYTKQLDSEWYFAKDGEATLTVFLVDGSGNQLANGQVTIAVQKTDYSGDPTITPDEYQELLEEIAKKLNIVDGIIKTSSISDLGNLDQYNVGQIFFVKNNLDTKLYQLNSSYNLDLLFDFKYIDAGRVESINLVLNRNAINNNLWLQLIDKNNLAIATASVTLHPASTTNAGLMSAEDKATLDNIPNVYETKEHASETYETKADAQSEHQDLQEQIDAIISKSDVVDVVGTYAELLAYDTSKLGNNDIIKVLVDESKNNQRSYYRWLKDDEEFEYVGSEGEYYTKAESDQIFLTKVDAQTEFAKKQNKVILMDHIPNVSQLKENDVVFVPSIEDLDSETILGYGLELNVSPTGVKTLKISQNVLDRIDRKSQSIAIPCENTRTWENIITTAKMGGGMFLKVFLHTYSYPEGIEITQDINAGLFDDLSLTNFNSLFNDDDETISLPGDTNGFLYVSVAGTIPAVHLYYIGITFNYDKYLMRPPFRTGDNLYIYENNVPDRWIDNTTSSVFYFRKLES